MNLPMIVSILGQVLLVEAGLMVLPMGVSLIYEESCAGAFAITAAILLAVSLLARLIRPKHRVFYAREGFVIVALSWVLLSAFGALPFWISGEIPHYVDCFFETVSGFTTTGASILANVETLSQGMLFWRSFTHWVGGMGVLVFVLAIVPMAGDHSMHLMRAEVPGPSVGKLVPKIRLTAKILYQIYMAMTLLQVVLLCLGGMSLFDALITAFGTAGTGGFSNRAASIGAWSSSYIHWVVTIFMILFGINFNLFYLLCLKKCRQALKSEELRWYLLIILAAVVMITIDILPRYAHVSTAVRDASFQVSSIITTTGFATTDFNLWPEFSKAILVLLMFVGACAGSTGGGIKVGRLIILIKSARREIRRMLHPRAVSAVHLEGKQVDDETLHSANAYLIVYMLLLLLSILLVSLNGMGFESTATSVITCFNNVGPGLGLVGPTGNFAGCSALSKLVLSLDMLLGRLEIFPMLMLVAPGVWKKNG